MFRDKLNQRKGEYNSKMKELNLKEEEVLSINEIILDLEECKFIVQDVSEKLQNKLADTLNSIVTNALSTVFDDPYEFKIEIESKANVVQATPTLVKDGESFGIKSDVGYGVVDVCALALRVALLSLQKNHNNVLVLDEPFKNIGKKDRAKACQLLKTMSEKLEIQFILVTHVDEIKDIADLLIEVDRKDKTSFIKQVTLREKIIEQ